MWTATPDRLHPVPVIVLFTDFGQAGPYTGQVKAVLFREAPAIPIIDLFADAPAHNPKAAAYLLPAYTAIFPVGTVFLCVIDPGVGSGRGAAILKADGRWYVGPDNGLFELIVRRAENAPLWWEITWRPGRLSATFHGRDLFAPVAARLALGRSPEEAAKVTKRPLDAVRRRDWPDDLPEIVYIDTFGNAVTGTRAATVPDTAIVKAGHHAFPHARTFSEMAPGRGFWYENSNGLLEIAVNQGRADALGLRLGAAITIEKL